MNRVVITGMGAVTPLSNDLAEFRTRLLAGKSGIGPLTLFPAGDLPVRIGAECCLEKYFYKDRKIDFALQAARSALAAADQAGLALSKVHVPKRCGLSLGIGLELFDMQDLVAFSHNNFQIPKSRIGCVDFLQTPADLCARLLLEQFSFGQPAAIHISACAAAGDALGHAFLKIQHGQADLMLAGGTDSMLNPLGLAGFCKLNALSTRNDAPAKASRPFDRQRDGFVLGEGAGMLVLENLDKARQRKARIFAEIIGYGNSFDAYTVSDPHPQGRGALQAMQRALGMAGIQAEQISYINAHGTSTPKNDAVETLAIKNLLGPHAYRIPISSTKSMIGHLISAAGAVEAIASILCANAGYVHATVNLENPDPDCDLDYVPISARKHKIDYFLSNSFAFGGQNACLVFRNEEGPC